jgi:acetyl-CoA carboxylase carboxyltransferase component
MTWEREVEGIERRRELAQQQGGPDGVARQHAYGKLTVRERIALLVDPGSFSEHGSVTGVSQLDAAGNLERFGPANVVTGVARIDGRPVVVCGDDFTISGGAFHAVGVRKGVYGDELAVKRRLPIVRMLEGGGARITGLGEKGRSGYDLTNNSPSNYWMAEALFTVPVVCLALGAVAGFPAARLVASHLSIMTRKTSQVLIGGPQLVERATKEKLSKEELGGAEVHLRSGVVDNAAEDDADALKQARQFLSYLPSNRSEPAPVVDCGDPRDRCDERLIEIVPRERRRAYRMRRILESVFDQGSFFEMTPLYGRSQITGLARLAGRSVGVFANDPFHDGGSMTAEGARKVRRFIETCDVFNLPIVSFVDEPGFLIGAAAERAGTIRYGVETLIAAQQSRVPWAAVVVRKSFGVAAGIHLGPGAMSFAWPSAEFGAMPLEGGVALAFGKEIAAAPDPDKRRREIEDRIAREQSVFPRAEEFGVHELIDPRRTRPALCNWLDEVQGALRANLNAGPPRYTLRP